MFNFGPFVIDSSFLTSEGDILIPIIIESPSAIGAFGFDLSFPSDDWTYVGLEVGDLTSNYNQLAGNVVSRRVPGTSPQAMGSRNNQFLRVGGYKMSDDNSTPVGVLMTLVFRTETGFAGPEEISIIAAYDNIRDALIYAGSSIGLRNNEGRTEGRRPADRQRGKPVGKKSDF